MRQRFLDVAGFAFELAIINFLNFRTSLRKFNQTNSSHEILSSVSRPIINKFAEVRCRRLKMETRETDMK
jgi:hypothetical protein